MSDALKVAPSSGDARAVNTADVGRHFACEAYSFQKRRANSRVRVFIETPNRQGFICTMAMTREVLAAIAQVARENLN